MATFDDMALEGKITVYDKGFDEQRRGSYGEYITRSGDIWSPRLPNVEPLRTEIEHFVQSIRDGTAPISDGEAGLRVVRVLEALQQSLDETRRDGVARIGRAVRDVNDARTLKVRAFKAIQAGAEPRRPAGRPEDLLQPDPGPGGAAGRTCSTAAARCAASTSTSTSRSPGSRRHLARRDAEFAAGADRTPGEYGDNASYGRVGADLLHGVVRASSRVGSSSWAPGIRHCSWPPPPSATRAEGAETELRTFDPYPDSGPAGAARARRARGVPAQDVPLEVFAALEAGDVLFVDTTHTVKLDCDVNRIVLDVLPALRRACSCTCTTSSCPTSTRAKWFEESGFYWAEQYLLQAFLAGNPDVEVLAATFALCRDRPDAMARLAPTWRPGAEASAFWFRTRPPGDPAALPPAPPPPRG